MKNILWVEDDLNHFEAFSRNIGKNYNISYSDNYSDAISRISDRNFDLYVIDIILPSGMKIESREDLFKVRDTYYGLKLISSIREGQNSTPIVVISVVSDSKDIADKITKIDPNIAILYKYSITNSEIEKTIMSFIGV